MALFNINKIRAELRFGGARPTLFQVTLSNPIVASADLKLPFMVMATQMPVWSTGNIPVPYFGRKINIPGDRVFQPWDIRVLNDEDFVVRDAFETWNNKINTLEGNLRDLPSSESIHYTTTAQVIQYSKTGQKLRGYEFDNAWPMTIGPIQLSWADNDQIEMFDVVLQYDSFKVLDFGTGDGGGV